MDGYDTTNFDMRKGNVHFYVFCDNLFGVLRSDFLI